MSLIELIPLVLSLVILGFTLLNSLTLWSTEITKDSAETKTAHNSISLLIPMRNEAANVEELLHALDSVEGIESIEVIALDDQSEDETSLRLKDANRSYLRVIEGRPVREGWLGKPHAMQQLFEASSNEILVFIDADVRLEPDGIKRAVLLMQARGWRFICPYPRQIALTFIERMVQPLLQWSWFASVPLRFAAWRQVPSMAVGNGQFFIAERKALTEIGGFEGVKGEVLEDVEMVRLLWRNKIKGSVIDASDLASCRMYQSASEVIAGYSKSLWKAFGSLSGATATALLLLATSWLPLILGLLGSAWGWLAFFAVSLSRLLAALRTRSFWQGFLLHPISVAILIYIVAVSFSKKRSGELSWRGRVIPA